MLLLLMLMVLLMMMVLLLLLLLLLLIAPAASPAAAHCTDSAAGRRLQNLRSRATTSPAPKSNRTSVQLRAARGLDLQQQGQPHTAVDAVKIPNYRVSSNLHGRSRDIADACSKKRICQHHVLRLQLRLPARQQVPRPRV